MNNLPAAPAVSRQPFVAVRSPLRLVACALLALIGPASRASSASAQPHIQPHLQPHNQTRSLRSAAPEPTVNLGRSGRALAQAPRLSVVSEGNEGSRVLQESSNSDAGMSLERSSSFEFEPQKAVGTLTGDIMAADATKMVVMSPDGSIASTSDLPAAFEGHDILFAYMDLNGNKGVSGGETGSLIYLEFADGTTAQGDLETAVHGFSVRVYSSGAIELGGVRDQDSSSSVSDEFFTATVSNEEITVTAVATHEDLFQTRSVVTNFNSHITAILASQGTSTVEDFAVLSYAIREVQNDMFDPNSEEEGGDARPGIISLSTCGGQHFCIASSSKTVQMLAGSIAGSANVDDADKDQEGVVDDMGVLAEITVPDVPLQSVDIGEGMIAVVQQSGEKSPLYVSLIAVDDETQLTCLGRAELPAGDYLDFVSAGSGQMAAINVNGAVDYYSADNSGDVCEVIVTPAPVATSTSESLSSSSIYYDFAINIESPLTGDRSLKQDFSSDITEKLVASASNPENFIYDSSVVDASGQDQNDMVLGIVEKRDGVLTSEFIINDTEAGEKTVYLILEDRSNPVTQAVIKMSYSVEGEPENSDGGSVWETIGIVVGSVVGGLALLGCAYKSCTTSEERSNHLQRCCPSGGMIDVRNRLTDYCCGASGSMRERSRGSGKSSSKTGSRSRPRPKRPSASREVPAASRSDNTRRDNRASTASRKPTSGQGNRNRRFSFDTSSARGRPASNRATHPDQGNLRGQLASAQQLAKQYPPSPSPSPRGEGKESNIDAS